jgi:hypothetical protein
MRNALAHVEKGQHTMVAAAIRQACKPTRTRHIRPGGTSPTSCGPRWPKLAALMDDSEHDVLAYMTFPAQQPHRLGGPRAHGARRVVGVSLSRLQYASRGECKGGEK